MVRVERWEMCPDTVLVYPECPYAGKFRPAWGGETGGECPCHHIDAVWPHCGLNYAEGCPFDLKAELSSMVPQGFAEIIVTRRERDFHACLKDHPGIWGCGRSHYEAVGNVISAHWEIFKVRVNHQWGVDDCKA
jgi:hypothetical protein